MFCQHVWMCTRAQRATGELELEKVVSCHVGAGNQTSVLCKSSKGSQLLSHLSGSNFNRYFKIKIFFLRFSHTDFEIQFAITAELHWHPSYLRCSALKSCLYGMYFLLHWTDEVVLIWRLTPVVCYLGGWGRRITWAHKVWDSMEKGQNVPPAWGTAVVL